MDKGIANPDIHLKFEIQFCKIFKQTGPVASDEHT